MFELPNADTSHSVADWVELEIALDRESVSKAWLTSVIEQASGDQPGEAFLTDVWRILEDRKHRYVASWFDIDGSTVDRSAQRPATIEPYVACLLFSLYGVCASRNDPKLLERLAAISIEQFLGGRSYVFGWPVLPDVPVEIAARVRDVCERTRERFVEAPRAQYKDRGVDIITWKPFAEAADGIHRSNQIVLLSQCAAGADWPTKTGQIPIYAWTQYVHWAIPPIRGFVVPAVIRDDRWHDISAEVGLLFDRIRLLNYVPHPFPDAGLLTELQNWVDAEKMLAQQ